VQYSTFPDQSSTTFTALIVLVRSKKSITKVSASRYYESIVNVVGEEMYFLESSPSSTKAVTILSSGNSSLNAAMPSGAQIRFRNKILDSGMPNVNHWYGRATF
jgi:hypothetical protein